MIEDEVVIMIVKDVAAGRYSCAIINNNVNVAQSVLILFQWKIRNMKILPVKVLSFS